MKFSNKDIGRFTRQIILKKIGISGQKKIFLSKVLIIGAGGLGCPLALYLANSGVGHIGVVDHDRVELSNLHRQIIFTPKDIGKFKVDIIKKTLQKINKKIKITTFKKKINEKNIKNIIKKFDIICDGTDNFKTRYLINDSCLKSKKVLISAAINKFDGQIFHFDFKNKIPCFRCFMTELPQKEINCETDGIMSTLAGIAGTLQANEVIKSILKIKNKLHGKILIFNSLNLNFRIVRLTKNINCINKCYKK